MTVFVIHFAELKINYLYDNWCHSICVHLHTITPSAIWINWLIDLIATQIISRWFLVFPLITDCDIQLNHDQLVVMVKIILQVQVQALFHKLNRRNIYFFSRKFASFNNSFLSDKLSIYRKIIAMQFITYFCFICLTRNSQYDISKVCTKLWWHQPNNLRTCWNSSMP